MDLKIWVYRHCMSTPLYFTSINKMMLGLSGLTEKGVIDICINRAVYRVSAKVISLIADNFCLRQPTVIAYAGESYPLEDEGDILSFLMKTKTHHFYVDGVYIKSNCQEILK